MKIVLTDAESTKNLGKVIGESITETTIIALSGPLGSGKTTFVQGLSKGLGIAEIVNSPTFTMLNEYHSGRLPLYHFDFYRLLDSGSQKTSLAEFLESEINEIFARRDEHVVIAYEWAELFVPVSIQPISEKASGNKLFLEFKYVENEREVVLDAQDPETLVLIQKLAETTR